MRSQFAVGLAALVFAGCASQAGVKNIGSESLMDKKSLVAVQVGSTEEGPQSVAVYTFLCEGQDASVPETHRKCELLGVQQASGASVGQTVATGLVGTIPAVAGNLALAYPASKLRPDTTHVNQAGGGATSTSESTQTQDAVASPHQSTEVGVSAKTSSSASSKAKSTQSQSQKQGQKQGQRQSQTQPAPAPMMPTVGVD